MNVDLNAPLGQFPMEQFEHFVDDFVEGHGLRGVDHSAYSRQFEQIVQEIVHFVGRSRNAGHVIPCSVLGSFSQIFHEHSRESLDRNQRALQVVGYRVGEAFQFVVLRFQLRDQSLSFSFCLPAFRRIFLEPSCHAVEGPAEFSDFVVSFRVDSIVQLAVGDPLHAIFQDANRLGDVPRRKIGQKASQGGQKRPEYCYFSSECIDGKEGLLRVNLGDQSPVADRHMTIRGKNISLAIVPRHHDALSSLHGKKERFEGT